jgi:hypothetical protein
MEEGASAPTPMVLLKIYIPISSPYQTSRLSSTTCSYGPLSLATRLLDTRPETEKTPSVATAKPQHDDARNDQHTLYRHANLNVNLGIPV